MMVLNESKRHNIYFCAYDFSENMRTEKREREAVEQETLETLKNALRKQKQSTSDAKEQAVDSQNRLDNSMADILSLFK